VGSKGSVTAPLKDVRDALCIPVDQACQPDPGGFDVVIGNPPYVRQEGLKAYKEYYSQHYKAFTSTADNYVNFIEQGIKLLNRDGFFGMIVSNKWLRAAYGEKLRGFLLEKASLKQIIDLSGLPVFSNATVRTVILICSAINNKQITQFRYLAPLPLNDFRSIKTGDDLLSSFNKLNKDIPLPQSSRISWSLANTNSIKLIEHLKDRSLLLKEYIHSKPYFGIKTGFNEAYIIDEETYKQFLLDDPKNSEILRPIIAGRDIRRYSIDFQNRYLIWSYIGIPINNYPVIFQHLKTFENQLQKRWDKGNNWWELRACDYYDYFFQPKIIYPDIATNCRFVFDDKGYFGANTTYFLPTVDKFLLGILNSRLAYFYFSQVCAGLESAKKTYLRFFGQYIEEFPVKTCLVGSNENRKLISLVEYIISLHQQFDKSNIPTEKNILQRQIDTIDKQIDALVYELYRLNEEEIKIVDGSSYIDI
jgi:hypothetical protein